MSDTTLVLYIAAFVVTFGIMLIAYYWPKKPPPPKMDPVTVQMIRAGVEQSLKFVQELKLCPRCKLLYAPSLGSHVCNANVIEF